VLRASKCGHNIGEKPFYDAVFFGQIGPFSMIIIIGKGDKMKKQITCHKCGKPAFCLDKSSKPICKSCAKRQDNFDRNQAAQED
jgi:ribosomal protein L37E